MFRALCAYIYVLAKVLLLLYPAQTKFTIVFNPTWMARSTSDGARPNVDY